LPPDFIELVERLGKMDDSSLVGIAQAVPDLVGGELEKLAPQVAARNAATPEDVITVAQVCVFLVQASQFNDVPLTEASSELVGFGLSPEAGAKLQTVVATILPIAPTLDAKRRRVVAERSALPTLRAIDILCDLRAVFGLDVTEAGSARERDSLAVVDWIPMGLVELITELNGEQKTISFQVDRSALEHLRRVAEVTLGRMANMIPPTGKNGDENHGD
jgi:hypothetical protein